MIDPFALFWLIVAGGFLAVLPVLVRHHRADLARCDHAPTGCPACSEADD